MKVRELIRELKRMPPELQVCVWDAPEDEYVPVVQALFEDGTSHVALLTKEVTGLVEARPEDDGHTPGGAAR